MDPAPYFRAGKLWELHSALLASPEVDDILGVAVLKHLVANYGLDTAASTAILGLLLTRCSAAFLHTTGARPLLEQIEDTLFILPQSSALDAFGVLSKGYIESSQLYPLLKPFKARLLAAAPSKPEICLRSLLSMPLSVPEITQVCAIARKHTTFSVATAQRGLEHKQWAPVVFETLYKWDFSGLDDTDVAKLELELLVVLIKQKTSLNCRGLLARRPKFTGPLAPLAHGVLIGYLENKQIIACELPSSLCEIYDEAAALLTVKGERSVVLNGTDDLFPSQYESLTPFNNELVGNFASYPRSKMLATINSIAALFPSAGTPSASHSDIPAEWVAIFETIVATESLLTDPELRLACCSAVARMFTFWRPTFSLSHDNVVGAWLIGCLRSSNRRLRILATRCIGAFVTAKLPEAKRFSQFRFITSWPADEQPETCLMIWAEAAVHGTDSEHLNVLLLRLLGMLDAQPAFIGALAYHNFKQVARRRRVTPWKLCMPFWDIIAVWIVRKIGKNQDPVVSRFCQLVGVTTDDFLARTSRYTVPYLAFRKRRSTLETIAEAKSQSLSTLLWEHQAVVTATFLTTDTLEDPMEFTERRWQELGHRFNAEFVQNMIMERSTEMLLNLIMRAPDKADDRAKVKEERLLTVLGIVTGESASSALSSTVVNRVIYKISGTMHNLFGPTSLKSRLDCLRGLDFLIRNSQRRFLSMIIPINTLLVSALEFPNQSHALALSVWHTMLSCMEDCTPEINLVFSVLAQMWDSFDDDARKEARSMMNLINDSPATEVFAREHGVPLVPFFYPARPYIEGKHETTILKELVARTQNENVYVVRQAVQEIVAFAHENQTTLQTSLCYPQGVERIQYAVRTLIDLSRRFPDPQTGITTPCIQSLCFIGAVDPNIVDIQRADDAPVVLANFDESQECREFAAYFAANYLLKMAAASTNPVEQNFLLYGIQDTLKFCELSAEKVDTPEFKAAWSKLFGPELYPELSPFLYTRYMSPSVKLSRASYPIFNDRIEYSSWVGELCFDLMCRTHGVNVDELFGLYHRIFREQIHTNPAVFEFLLPYVALNAVLYSSENQDLFKQEMEAVMWSPSTASNNLSQFHERFFAVLDYFARWRQSKREQVLSAQDQRALSVISTLETEISLEQLAERAHDCKSYSRELRYLDQLARQNEASSERYCEAMRSIYASLGDSDSLEGMATLQTESSLSDQIELYESKGDWMSALALYDTRPNYAEHERLECLHNLSRDNEVLAILDETPEYSSSLASLGVKAALETSSKSKLSKYVRESVGHNDILERYFGQALLALGQNDLETCIKCMEAGIAAAGSRLNATDVTSLAKIRPISLYLHAAADICQIAAWHGEGRGSSEEFVSQRLLPLGNDLEARKYVFSMRRAAMTFAAYSEYDYMLVHESLGKDYRKKGQYNLALTHLSVAVQNSSDKWLESTRQMAKLLWKRGERQRAIKLLESSIDQKFLDKQPSLPSNSNQTDRRIALLYTTWLDQSGQVMASSLYSKYTAVLKEWPAWQKALYCFYKYYDRIYQAQLQLPAAARSGDFWGGLWTRQMVHLCSKTLTAGSKYFSEILPKLLTLWLDFADQVVLVNVELDQRTISGYNAERQRNLKIIAGLISKRAADMDPHILYHGVPQLMSRVTKVDEHTFKIIVRLIVQVIKAFPEHALWMIAEATQSKSSSRRRRGDEIVKALLAESGSTARQVIPQALMTIRRLKELALYEKANGKQRLPSTIQLSQIEFDTSWLPSPLVVPVHKILSCDALSIHRLAKLHSTAQLKLLRFSGTVSMYKVENEVSVQPSLQQPKRITVWGSDGQRYHLLCKGRDDVRKDARLIELSVTVNRLLDADRDAAQRHLRIEPYRVIPLSGDSGIIEWVAGAVPQRTIIESNLKARGIKLDMKQVAGLLAHTLTNERRMANFLALEKKYPSVLYEWFLYTFSDPEAWYKARTLYARSAAVMSMVGYILGLGDRHNENLLLLQSSGAQMHVDFECLFDKGLSLAVPERVPFRLTQNMVDALGVFGYEGPFRRTSEIALGILREHEEQVMTVLETFLYDPVVMRGEEGGPDATLAVVRDKLRGLRSSGSPALSVAGHVDSLISQATSPENLSLMYCGWAAFL